MEEVAGGKCRRRAATTTASSSEVTVILVFSASVPLVVLHPRRSSVSHVGSVTTRRRDHVQVTGRTEQVPEAAGDHHGLRAVSHAQPLHRGAAVHVLAGDHGHPVRR